MCPYTGSHQAESEETAHQTAEGRSEKTSAEGRGQPGDQGEERESEQHQGQFGGGFLLGLRMEDMTAGSRTVFSVTCV